MPINENGEFIREKDVTPSNENDPERLNALEKARQLAEAQDQAPESTTEFSSERRAAMKKRLLEK